MPCFGAGPWRVARETVGQLQRCSQRRVGDSGCFLGYHTPSPLQGKGSLRPLSLDLTKVMVLILPSLDRAASSSLKLKLAGASKSPQGGRWYQTPLPPPPTPHLLRNSGPIQLAWASVNSCCVHSGFPPDGKRQSWLKRLPGSKPGIIIDGATVDF